MVSTSPSKKTEEQETEDKSCCSKLFIKPYWKMSKAKSTMNGRVAPSPRPNGDEVNNSYIKENYFLN